MIGVTLHEGDNRDHLRRLIDQGVRVHSVVTDPPYGLTSVVKRFGKDGAAPAKHGTDGAFSRASGGFMGKVWDGTGIERDPEFWRLIWEILLPGGFVFAFSGSRTGHWQACAMEQAGFVMHPMHGWVYGSGMPKAHNAERAVDAAVCTQPGRHIASRLSDEPQPGDHLCESSSDGDPWAGWAYGTQSQKPALEPIYLGQKPFSEKTGAANLLKHGVGAVNIEGCRIETIRPAATYSQPNIRGGQYNSEKAKRQTSEVPENLGRWPANLLHDGSAEVVALFPDSKGQQGAILGSEPSRTGDANTHCYGEYGARRPTPVRGDDGSAARFFNSFPVACEACGDSGTVIEWCENHPVGYGVCSVCWGASSGIDAPAIIYHAKATKADRAGSKHPTVKSVGLIEHLIRHVTPPGGLVLDPFAGSGTTGEAARRLGFDCILMEQDPDYAAFLRQRFDLCDDLADLLGPTPQPIVSANDISFLDEDIKLLLG